MFCQYILIKPERSGDNVNCYNNNEQLQLQLSPEQVTLSRIWLNLKISPLKGIKIQVFQVIIPDSYFFLFKKNIIFNFHSFF